MASQQTSSAAVLLWAAQLKREHAFLLQRMQKVETEMQSLQTSTEYRQSPQDAVQGMAAVADHVRAIFASNDNELMARSLKPLADGLENLQRDFEGLSSAVASVQEHCMNIEHERRKATAKEENLLKRVCELEERQKGFQQEFARLTNGTEFLSKQELSDIGHRVMKLQDEMMKEKQSKTLLNAKMEALELAQNGPARDQQAVQTQVHQTVPRKENPPPSSTLERLTQLPTKATNTRLERVEHHQSPLLLHQLSGASRTTKKQAATSVATPDSGFTATRLRPRKHLNTAGPELRHGPKADQSPGKPNNQDALQRARRSPQRRTSQEPRENQAPSKVRRGLTGILSSPLSSPPASLNLSRRRPDQRAQSDLNSRGKRAEAPERIQAPPRQRRRILQTCELPDITM